MNGERVAGEVAPSSSENGEKVTPGVGTLLQAGRSKDNIFAEPAASESSAEPEPALLPAWYLLAADLALIAFALVVAWRSVNFGFKEAAFCIAAIVLGAGLSVFAILNRR